MTDPRSGFLVEVQVHTDYGRLILDHPERLRFIVGAALEAEGLVEEVDITIKVDRSMPLIRGVRK